MYAADSRILIRIFTCLNIFYMPLLYQNESYAIIGIMMEVHKNLGGGFSEIVYKDAIEYELKTHGIDFKREQKYDVLYKRFVLPHSFYADFVILDKIILEIKSCKQLSEEHVSQCLNYLKVSGLKVALLVNFRRKSLEYKRVVLEKFSN